jgi:hypothetical protein
MHSRPEHPAVSMPKPHGPKAHAGGSHSTRLPRATHSRHATTDMFNVHRHGRKANWWFVAGCALFMACYFLPWFTAGGASMLGFEVSYYIPRYLRDVGAEDGIVWASNSLWLFAFVGIWALFAMGDEFTGMRRNKNRRWIRAVTAASPLMIIALVMLCFALLGGGGLHEVLVPLMRVSSVGLWVMLIAMLLCGISVAIHPRAAQANSHGPVPAGAH